MSGTVEQNIPDVTSCTTVPKRQGLRFGDPLSWFNYLRFCFIQPRERGNIISIAPSSTNAYATARSKIVLPYLQVKDHITSDTRSAATILYYCLLLPLARHHMIVLRED